MFMRIVRRQYVPTLQEREAASISEIELALQKLPAVSAIQIYPLRRSLFFLQESLLIRTVHAARQQQHHYTPFTA